MCFDRCLERKLRCKPHKKSWSVLIGPPTAASYNGGSIYKPFRLRRILDSNLWSVMRMSSSLNLVTLGLLGVSCLPDPDPGTYYFSKTVWVTDKEVPSYETKRLNKLGEIQKFFFRSLTFKRSLKRALIR